jgi:hypothetical protein
MNVKLILQQILAVFRITLWRVKGTLQLNLQHTLRLTFYQFKQN